MAGKMNTNGVAGPRSMHTHPQRGWIGDERDGFIAWIRGEFAAANAIIDALCQHLKIVGDASEYDIVLSAIQQRRLNWHAVLHLQQYFSISDVLYAIQQASWRKQQQRHQNPQRHHQQRYDNSSYNFRYNGNGKKFKNQWHNKNERFARKDSGNSDARSSSLDERLSGSGNSVNGEAKDKDSKPFHADCVNENENSGSKSLECSEESPSSARQTNEGTHGNIPFPCEFKLISKEEEDKRRSMVAFTKDFIGNEPVEGKMINIVEGLQLYENIFDNSELSLLASLAKDLRLSGKRGELKGNTLAISKRPIKGYSREMIQLGIPVSDGSIQDDSQTGKLKDLVEPIPKLFLSVIDRLLKWQIIPEKERPDCCIVNFFNEGDHLQPYITPPQFGRPFCTLSLLSECKLVFGQSIVINHPGDYRGPSKISLHAGSLLVMQGNVADIAKQSICSSPTKRITVTFVKVHPTKAAAPSTGMQNSLSSSNLQRTQVSAHQQNISIPSSRDGRTTRQPTTKHYVPASVSGVLPVLPVTPSPSQPLSAPAMPQLFPPSQGAGAAYSPVAVVPPAWPTAPRGAPRVLSPGTGVFLPPGGSNSASHLASLSQQPSSDTSSALSNGETTNATSTNASVTSCSMPSISNNESPSQVAIENSEKESEKADVVESSQSESECSPYKTATSNEINSSENQKQMEA